MDGGHDAHSQSHSDDDDDDDDPGPARKPLFLAYTQESRTTDRPDKARPSVQWKGRGRPACRPCSPASSARWWAVALPPTSTSYGLVWSGRVWSVSDLV